MKIINFIINTGDACVLADSCFGTRHKDGVYAYAAGAGQPIKVMSQAEVLRLKHAGASHSGFLYALGPDGVGPIGELWAYAPGASAPLLLDVDSLCTPQIVYDTGSQFTATASGAFYAANDGRVCFTKGTAGTTQVVANPFNSTNPNDNSTVAVFLGRVGEMLFFCTTPQGGPYCSELRVAESTPGNAQLIDTPELFAIIRAVVVGERLLFTGARCPGGTNCNPAIWVSDGSSEGTTTLAVDNPESRPIALGHLDSLGDVALFRTEPTFNQRAYWITDGTQDGTQLLETLPAAGFINPLAIHNGFLYYGRHPGDGSQQFWRTTGSPADATEVSAPWTDEGKNHTISHAQTSNGFLAYIRANKVWLMSEESTHFSIFEPGQGGQAHQLLAGETTLFMSLKEGGETVQPPPESDENTELLAGLELLDFAEDDVGWELFQFVTDAPGFLSSEPIVSDESGPLSGPELLIGNVSFADSFE